MNTAYHKSGSQVSHDHAAHVYAASAVKSNTAGASAGDVKLAPSNAADASAGAALLNAAGASA